MVERQQFADKAGGAYRDIVCGCAQQLGDLFSSGLGLLIARLAGAGIGSARIENHRFDMAIGNDLAGPLHRSRTETVRREYGSRQGHILLTLDGGNASSHTGRGESLCKRYTHGATPIFVSPASSGSPNATFNDCTACPAVPRLRLSMAANASRRPAL